MLALAAFCVLIGTILALRFTVWIMVPGIAFGLFAAATAGFVHHQELSAIALTMMLIAAGLQLGYLAGAGLRYAVIAARGRLTALSHPAH